MEQKSLAKLQKDIDRASTKLLDVRGTLWNGKRSLWGRPNIRESWEKFASYTHFEVGVGSQVLFWKYHWDSNGTF